MHRLGLTRGRKRGRRGFDLAPRPLAKPLLQVVARERTPHIRCLHLLPSVVDGEAPALHAHGEPHGGKPLLHLRPRLRGLQHGRGLPIGPVQEQSIPAYQRGRGLAPRNARQPARHDAQPKLYLLRAQLLLDLRPVPPPFPCPVVHRVDAVDHDVQVRVARVLVREVDGLVLGEAQPAEHGVRNAGHAFAVHRVAGIEADGQVIDRALRQARLFRRGGHEARRGVGAPRRQVAGVDPGNALALLPGRARL